MTINVSRERVLPLNKAAKLVPRVRPGKKVHIATLRRWHSPGLRGTQLECIRIGGTLCTSVEALQRFFDRLTLADQDSVHHPTKADDPNDHEVETKLLELKVLGNESESPNYP